MPERLCKVVLYELPAEGLETHADFVMTLCCYFIFRDICTLCKLLLMVYLKLEMCFYLFKAENKILLHNGGVWFYLLQPNVVFNTALMFQDLYFLSPVCHIIQCKD